MEDLNYFFGTDIRPLWVTKHKDESNEVRNYRKHTALRLQFRGFMGRVIDYGEHAHVKPLEENKKIVSKKDRDPITDKFTPDDTVYRLGVQLWHSEPEIVFSNQFK
jgi:hypothetical protein